MDSFIGLNDNLAVLYGVRSAVACPLMNSPLTEGKVLSEGENVAINI